jgi:hypothetical protein
MTEDWLLPLARTAQPFPVPDGSIALPWNGSPARAAPSSDPGPVDPLTSRPRLPPGPRSPFEPALDLKAPGPGMLGRLRRRPLTASQTPRPPLTTRAEEPRPRVRRSSGDECAAASRPRSASVAPTRAAEGPRGGAVTKARAPAGPSTARSRTPGKAATKKAAGTTGPSGPRKGSRSGAGPAKQARPQKNAAE